LEALNTISAGFDVRANPLLESFSGLPSLSHTGSIEVRESPALANMAGMSGLNSTFGLEIYDNLSLTYLGLTSLDTAHNINIYNNAVLPNLSGLGSLNFAGGLRVHSNPSLQSLEGLGSLERLTDLFLDNNAILSDILSLDHDVYITGEVTITNNPMLSWCSVQGICQYVLPGPSPGTPTFFNNMDGCNGMWEDIIPACLVPVEEENLEQNFLKIFPNPATDEVWIELPESTTTSDIRIFDVAGKLYNQVHITNSQRVPLNIEALPSGAYVVELKTNRGFFNQKLIKL